MREMKDSGVAWIGSIPSTWKLERLQWHLTEIKESNNPIQTRQVLSLTNKLGVVPYEEKGNQGNVAKENYDEYKLAYPGTIVANSMNILIGSVGICNYFGCVSPVYYVYKPHDGENLHFLNYIFQAQEFQKELRRYANGILEIRLRVSSDGILKQPIAFPNMTEQERIVSYLDAQCAKIDALIANQQAQIEKLKQYKLSFATEVLQHGLNNNAAMIDTGIDYIGKIPAHWQIKKAKAIASRIVVGVVIKPADYFSDQGTVPFLRGMNVKEYNLDPAEEDIVYITEESNQILSKSIVHEDDILIVRDGSIGTSCVVPHKFDGANVVSMIILTADINNNPYFICYCLNSFIGKHQFEITKIGSALTHTSVNTVSNLQMVVPPLEEQDQIVKYLNLKCAQINRLIEIKQMKVEKLNQYKKSLIYEYVTGKKEVTA